MLVKGATALTKSHEKIIKDCAITLLFDSRIIGGTAETVLKFRSDVSILSGFWTSVVASRFCKIIRGKQTILR